MKLVGCQRTAIVASSPCIMRKRTCTERRVMCRTMELKCESCAGHRIAAADLASGYAAMSLASVCAATFRAFAVLLLRSCTISGTAPEQKPSRHEHVGTQAFLPQPTVCTADRSSTNGRAHRSMPAASCGTLLRDARTNVSSTACVAEGETVERHCTLTGMHGFMSPNL